MTYTILRIGKKPYFYTYTVNVTGYTRMLHAELRHGTYKTKGIQDQYDGKQMPIKNLGVVYTKRDAMALQMAFADKDKKCLNYSQHSKNDKGILKPYKLTPSKIRKIRDLCHSGLSLRKIADLFNISHVTVVRVKTGESYSYVE